jgi:hypothetical protein
MSFAVILIAVDFIKMIFEPFICFFAIVDFLWSIGLFAI